MTTKPLSPQEVIEQRSSGAYLPEFVISAVNKLLIRCVSDSGCATLHQRLVINAIKQENPSITTNMIIDNKWLDFEPVFRSSGWNVVYDKLGYSDNYEPYWNFSPK